jgi:hypothetical protein
MYNQLKTSTKVLASINEISLSLPADGTPVIFGTVGTFVLIKSTTGSGDNTIKLKAYQGDQLLAEAESADDYWRFDMPSKNTNEPVFFDRLEFYANGGTAGEISVYVGSGGVTVPGAVAVVDVINEVKLVDEVTNVTNVDTVAAVTEVTNPVKAINDTNALYTLPNIKTINALDNLGGGAIPILSYNITLPIANAIITSFACQISITTGAPPTDGQLALRDSNGFPAISAGWAEGKFFASAPGGIINWFVNNINHKMSSAALNLFVETFGAAVGTWGTISYSISYYEPTI